jgi:hypothetical protein
MQGTSRLLAPVVGLMLLSTPAFLDAQHPAGPANRVDAGAPASPVGIQGVVRDDQGRPVVGAVVSAVGAATVFAVSDREGRFALLGLAPGPYQLRAHQRGYATVRPEIVQVAPGELLPRAVTLRRAGTSSPILAAGVGVAAQTAEAEAEVAVEPEVQPAVPPVDHEDHTETAWRIRHARRPILKDTTYQDGLFADAELGGRDFDPFDLLGRAVGSPARLATNFLSDTPFFGQVNFLAASTFGGPEVLYSDTFSRGIARVMVGAPVGSNADWIVRGALTEADISSWIVAGSYATRDSSRLRYDVGLSYSTQRYDGGNPLALRDVSDGSRNAGSVHGFTTFTVSPSLELTYGARFARYDYLDHRALISPRLEAVLMPGDEWRITTALSRRADAPGAEEFLPPGDAGIWLPPQRTFSSIEPGRPFKAEQTTRLEVEVERDISSSTVAVRAFHEEVLGQLVTIFGADVPGQPAAKVGHYFVGNAGNVEAAGCTTEFRTVFGDRVNGAVSYTMTQARLVPTEDPRYLLLLVPSAVRPTRDRIHDLSTSIEATVPETSTRVLVLYRASSGFAQADSDGRPGFDSRFDVQVRQSLPFMNFNSARWEMLLAVRNFFRDSGAEQNVYDELLVVRPPKRIVGGVTLNF